MKIGIDAHGVGGHSLGPGNETYFQNLIGALLDIDSQNEYHIFVNHPESMENTVAGHSNARLAPLWPHSQWIQRPVSVPLYATRHNLDLVHVPFIRPPFMRAKTVLTVHDVNFEIYPQDFTLPVRWRLKTFVGSSIRKADVIFTVSEFGRQQIHSVYGVPLEKIIVTYNAADHLRFDGSKPTDRTAQHLALPQRFLFFVGAIQPKKNLARLVRAFDRLISKSDIPHHLLIAGKWGWGNDDLSAALDQVIHRDRVRLLGYLTPGELVTTMRLADAFTFPSLYECFGIPPMEAQLAGIPALVSDTTCFPEIYRDSVLYCDPENVDSIEAALRTLVSNPTLREELAVKGLAQARKFTWKRSAAVALNAYKDVYSSRRVPIEGRLSCEN
ncbi:MAG: glycosyltransferase family 4 protein [Bryobacteraceae bacterium]|nr:glycosyltransferase family 4 protein [Bryobacteraceae bacterium]